MISDEGSPTLIDFGFSGLIHVKCGTNKYYAPEQWSALEDTQGMNPRKFDSW